MSDHERRVTGGAASAGDERAPLDGAVHPRRQWLDRLVERGARGVAQRTSRRSFLTKLGTLLVGGAALPLLPVARGADEPARLPVPDDKLLTGEVGDPKSCNYWRHCAIDGFLCSCCGGSVQSCPPGTEASAVTWVGTCHNPGDDRDYIVSYNDCCGKVSCGNCECNRNEREKPMYRPSRNNDLNWCMANADSNYHCSVSVILGPAEK